MDQRGQDQTNDHATVDIGAGPDGFLETGEPRVDAALTRLEQLSEAPIQEHVPTYEGVYQTLTTALAGIDEG